MLHLFSILESLGSRNYSGVRVHEKTFELLTIPIPSGETPKVDVFIFSVRLSYMY